MAEMWIPRNPEILKYWVQTILLEASDELNDWEIKFVNDMDLRLTRGSILTESQENKLEQIYAEKTS